MAQKKIKHGQSGHKIMKCVLCDNTQELKEKRITVKYKECGLSNVTLHGVECHKCPKCGEEYFGYGNMEQLHAVIAQTLIRKNLPLNGAELRFLRTFLGYSGAMLAALTGYQPETISRFENNKQPVSKTFDVLMRSLVLTKSPDRSYDLHDVLIKNNGLVLKQIELNTSHGVWSLKHAA